MLNKNLTVCVALLNQLSLQSIRLGFIRIITGNQTPTWASLGRLKVLI